MELLQYIQLPILLALTMLANLGGSIINRHYSKNISSGVGGFYLYTTVTSVICAVLLFFATGFNLKVSLTTVLLGVTFGFVSASSSIFGSWAISIGPWSYTTVLISLSMLIPTLFGAIAWHEPIDIMTIFGIIFVVLCIILSVQKSNEKEKRASLRWAIFVMIAAFSTGAIGVLQKIHQNSSYSDEIMMFLTIAFTVSSTISAVSFVVYLIKNGKKSLLQNVSKKPSKILLILLIVLAGICAMLNNVINLYLSGVMNSAIFYPLVNGGHLVLITLISFFVYKEKLTIKQICGLICGIVAVLLLCL